MKSLVKYLSLVAFLLSCQTAFGQQVKVGFSAEPYPPFANQDASGKWGGWEIEIVDAVCKAAALDCVLTPTSWDGIIPALNAGQIDAIMGSMTITPDRLKVIDFSDYYYKTAPVIVGTAGVAMAPTAEGLSGKIIGVQTATILQKYAEKYFSGTAAEIKIYQTQDEINQDLAAGRIDATLADQVAMEEFVKSDTGKACCEMKGKVADDPEILGAGIGVGLRKGDQALKEAFNTGIAKILADGTYDKITAKYFTTSLY